MSKKINNPKFQTMRHIEAVRNYLTMAAKELLDRGITHDQSKFDPVEMEIIEKYIPLLHGVPYASPKYHEIMRSLKPSTNHHYKHNSHHPEHYPDKISGMTLFDILEMLCDWKAASLRNSYDGLNKSIEINAKKYKISPQLTKILKNTAKFVEKQEVYHKADES